MEPIEKTARARLLSRHRALATGGPRSPEAESELAELQAALDRVADGRFGRCEDCGQAIGRQRLSAIPEARRCMGCAETVAPLRPSMG